PAAHFPLLPYASTAANELVSWRSPDHGAKLPAQLPLRNGWICAHVVRVGAPPPIALFVTDVPVNPNIARISINPSVSASIALLPSTSRLHALPNSVPVPTRNVAAPPPTWNTDSVIRLFTGAERCRTHAYEPVVMVPVAVTNPPLAS